MKLISKQMSAFKQSSGERRTGFAKSVNRATFGREAESSNWRAVSTTETTQSESEKWVTVGQKPATETTQSRTKYPSKTPHVAGRGGQGGYGGYGGHGGHGAARSDDKSTGHYQHRGYNSKSAIKTWASSSKACADMMAEYKANIGTWEAEKFSSDNRSTMIKDLARNLRYDVLGELIHLNPKFSSGLSVKGYTPLQYVGYPDKNAAKLATLADLIATASVLIDGYGFKIFMSCDEEVHEKETIFGALQTRHNPLPEELRLAFYDFLTQEAPSTWFFPNFKANLGKLSPANVATFQNKFLAVLSRFPQQAANTFFFQLMMIRAPRAERLFLVELPVKTLLSTPITTDYEMNRYFETTDVRAAQMEFVNEILSKGAEWILDDASGFAVGSEAHSDRVALNSRIYFSVLGSIYTLGFAKSEILDLVNRLISDASRPSWVARAIAMFTIHANIVYGSTADAVESKLLVDFVKSCYKAGCLKDKIDIEIGTVMTASQITSLIVDATPAPEPTGTESMADEPDWDKLLANIGDEIADFD